jgi:putative transposase
MPWQVGAKWGKNQKPLTDVEMELARVKRELAEIRMERDLLKNGGLLREGQYLVVPSVAVKYGRMEELRQRNPVAVMMSCPAVGWWCANLG